MRRLAASVSLLLACSAPAAVAAPARYCRLLNDDGQELAQERAVPGSASDVTILSADVANDARDLTVVVRVRALPDVPAQAVNGAVYSFGFSASPEHHYVLTARLGAERSFEAYRHTQPWYGAYEHPDGLTIDQFTRLGDARGVVDLAADEIRMTVPLSMLAFSRNGFRPGTRLNYLGVNTHRTHGDATVPAPVPASYLMYNQDALSGGRGLHYPAGAPSCVRVGR